MWQETYNSHWAVGNDILFCKGLFGGEKYYMFPQGVTPNDYGYVKNVLLEDADGQVIFEGILEQQKQVIRNIFPSVDFVENRDNFDYVYLRSELESFSGRKFHGQKNHLNSFLKEHPDVEYETITRYNAKECLDFALAWCDERQEKDATIVHEKLALQKCFANFEELNLRGGLLRFDGKVQAMSVGDKFNQNTADLHFEKAKSGVRGLYVAMCNFFARNAWQDVVYLNREEDMGLEGLRKAKENLHPVMMIKKYTAVVK